MGSNSLITMSDGTVIDASDINQYKTAFNQNHIPRNSSGVAANEGGTLGESSLKWLRAYITGGYWNVGDIKPHHSFNDEINIGPGQGWFLANGNIINEANYEAQSWASAGDWDTYVVSSLLDGKYSPNISGKYLVGVSSTTQTGGSAITTVGNTSHQINIQHSHTVDSHTHTINHTHGSDPNQIPSGVVANAINTAAFSGSSGGDAPGTDNQLSATQTIQPESIQVQYYIRLI